MKLPSSIIAVVAAIAGALLPACDFIDLPEIKPGITTASEVRARLGEPDFEFHNPDGSMTWEYTRQPAGVHCYMLTIGRDQIVRKMEQVLTETNYGKVRDGMTPEDIRRLLGAPASKIVFDNLGEDIWEWHVEGVPLTENSYFMVHFDLGTGTVKKTSKRIAMQG